MEERLAELLGNLEMQYCEMHSITKENVAQYLIQQGVIVLQCKVGDTVYQTDGENIYGLEILDVCLRKNKPYYETESIDFDADAIGKSVFLTYKEAWKALAERSENEYRTGD